MKIVLAACLFFAACSKKDEQPANLRPVAIPAVERQRGTDACKAYVDKLCACAKAHPERADVKDRCDRDQALPSAMSLALGIDDDPDVAPEDVFRAQGEARKVIATCVEGINWLATHQCQ